MERGVLVPRSTARADGMDGVDVEGAAAAGAAAASGRGGGGGIKTIGLGGVVNIIVAVCQQCFVLCVHDMYMY